MPFTIEDDVLVAYLGNEEVVTVPANIKTIGEGAFRGNDRVRRIYLDTDVTLIMREAFAGCTSLTKLECSSCWWLEVGSRAFAECTALTHVTLPNALAKLEDDAFEGCTSLRYVSIPKVFRGSESQRHRFEKSAQAIRDRCPNVVAIEGRRTMGEMSSGTEPPWSTGTMAQAVLSLEHPSMSYTDFADRWKDEGAVGLFKGYAELEHLDLAGLDTSDEKSLACMFKGCAKLREIDLSPLDTSAVEDMRQMFFGCRSLEDVDLSCLNTSQVRTMAHLFHNCHALRHVSLRGLDLSQVKSLWSTFDHCESLEDLDLAVAAMPPVEKTGYLFRGCTSIRRMQVSETWPVRHDTIPTPTSACGMWWSAREQAWMSVRQIVERGPASDVFTNVSPDSAQCASGQLG